MATYIPQVGDVILVKGSSWLARAIQYFMKKYRRSRNLPNVDVITNHAALIVELWGVLVVVEAGAHGVAVKYSIYEYLQKHRVKIKRINKSIHPQFSKIASSYFVSPHRYDFLNFIHQIVLIITGYWIGPKKYKATNRLYCSEYVALVLDECYGIYNNQTWDKNPLDIDLTPELNDVYRNF